MIVPIDRRERVTVVRVYALFCSDSGGEECVPESFTGRTYVDVQEFIHC